MTHRPRSRQAAPTAVRTAAAVLAALLAAPLAACTTEAGTGDAQALYPDRFTPEKPDPALRARLPAAVRAAGRLVVAASTDSPPDEFTDAKARPVGWEVEMSRAVAQRLGLRPSYQKASFDSLIPGLQAHRYDLAIGQFGVTAVREKVVDFVTEIQANEGFAALKTSHERVRGLDDLCGRTVALVRGSSESRFADKQQARCARLRRPPVDVKVFQDSNSAWLSVLSARVPLFWNGGTNISYLVDQSNDRAEVVGHYEALSPIGIAFPKGSPLAAPVRDALAGLMRDGKYAEILRKWNLQGGTLRRPLLNPHVE
ncbi:MAG TPA: ABC transporter substrate-binding protein [Streptosporangiaceae bacterium]|jgi:polar amino acid transport system substrate-binding protein